MKQNQKLAIEEKKKELEKFKKQNLELMNERSTLNHHNLITQDGIETQLRSLKTQFSKQFKTKNDGSIYNNSYEPERGLVEEPVADQGEALKKYLKLNCNAKTRLNEQSTFLDSYKSFKGISINENALQRNSIEVSNSKKKN